MTNHSNPAPFASNEEATRTKGSDIHALRWAPVLVDGRRFSRSALELAPHRVRATEASLEGLLGALARDAEAVQAVPSYSNDYLLSLSDAELADLASEGAIGGADVVWARLEKRQRQARDEASVDMLRTEMAPAEHESYSDRILRLVRPHLADE